MNGYLSKLFMSVTPKRIGNLLHYTLGSIKYSICDEVGCYFGDINYDICISAADDLLTLGVVYSGCLSGSRVFFSEFSKKIHGFEEYMDTLGVHDFNDLVRFAYNAVAIENISFSISDIFFDITLGDRVNLFTYNIVGCNGAVLRSILKEFGLL